MANNLYYGRGNDEENERLIAFLNEVFFTDDPEGRDFLSLLPIRTSRKCTTGAAQITAKAA